MSFKPRPARAASQKPPKLKGFKSATKGGPKLRTRKPAPSTLKRQNERLKVILKTAAQAAETDKLKPTVRVHTNKDGTIDGEIRITSLPRGVSANDALEMLWENLPNRVEDTFISIGIRHADDEGSGSADRRYRGLYQVQTNYQDASKRANMVDNILIAQEKMLVNMKRKRRRKAQDVFIRFHWNQRKARPDR